MASFKDWVTSATTGQGAVVVLGSVLAYLQGSADKATALVGVVSGLALIAFPERPGMQASAGVVMKDIEGALGIYLTGVQHGMTGKAAALSAVEQSGGQVVSDTAKLVDVASAPAVGPGSVVVPTVNQVVPTVNQ